MTKKRTKRRMITTTVDCTSVTTRLSSSKKAKHTSSEGKLPASDEQHDDNDVKDDCEEDNSISKRNEEVTTSRQRPRGEQQQQHERQYFLLKSEPDEFSIDDLERSSKNVDGCAEEWDGVRNYAARNVMRTMNVNDLCWFYHSSCKVPAIVGVCVVKRAAQPDETGYIDPKHKNYDPKSNGKKENCRWDSVLVQLVEKYTTSITLQEIRAAAKNGDDVVKNMVLLNRSRLSVQPVTKIEWDRVHELIRKKEQGNDLTTLSFDDSSG